MLLKDVDMRGKITDTLSKITMSWLIEDQRSFPEFDHQEAKEEVDVEAGGIKEGEGEVDMVVVGIHSDQMMAVEMMDLHTGMTDVVQGILGVVEEQD